MVVLIGLGNPGAAYQRTRHNAGSMVIEALAREHGIRWKTKPGVVKYGGGACDGRPVTLGVPLTFMNASGRAVESLLGDAPLTTLLVICDDVELPFGTLRIRARGSDGGHKGLRSIIETIGSEQFPRMRIGVGNPGRPQALTDFVLGSFSAQERRDWAEVERAAVEACAMWVRAGLEATMNRYNRKVAG